MTTTIKHSFREFKKFYQILLRKNFLIIFCFLGVLVQPVKLIAGEAWQVFQENHELTVYTRKTEEYVKSEFKAVIIIHQPIEVVGSVLMDIPTYMKWLDGCREVKLLDKKHDSNYEVYFAIDTPWPFYARDIIYRIKNDEAGGEESMIVRGLAIEKFNVPIREGHVRVKDAYFCVALEKLNNGSTKVIYQSKTDVCFSAPAYLSRTICGNMVYNSMVNLKKLLNNGSRY